MDKKSLIGLIIIGVILFGFTWYNSKQAEEFNRQQAIADSIALAHNALISEPDSAVFAQQPAGPAGGGLPEQSAAVSADSALARHLGPALYAATKGEEQVYTIENDLMKISVSNRGGRVSSVELKDYKTYAGDPLVLFDDSTSVFDLSFFIRGDYNNMQVNTGAYYFTTDAPRQIAFAEGEAEKSLSMRLYVDSAAYVEYLYTVKKDNYMIDFDVRFVNMANLLSNQSDFEITWENVSPQNEKGFENENNYTTIAYMYPGSDALEELGMSKESKSENVDTKLKWIAFKQQFFSSVFVAGKDFQNATVSYDTYQPGSGKIKKFYAKIAVPFNPQNADYNFQFYYGPNKYSTLKKYDIGIQKLVPLGWGIFGWVNRWIVIPVFNFLGGFISNFGVIILLLTIFIKILISPLTYKSYLSTAKMRLLKPEMDAINAKYPKQEDAMKKQQATMELYRRAGVNPMGGCLPLLIQFPILIAMFRFFPASIELRGEHFLWADDLSSYDSILNLPFNIPFYGDHVSLFALLMALSVFISSKINYTQTASAGPQMAGMKFMMLYMMPLMLLLWFNNYSSGLSYYYLVSNIITIGQTYAFRYAVNDEKLHRKMKENAKKPVKKSKFQQRYEEALKAQQQQARNRKR